MQVKPHLALNSIAARRFIQWISNGYVLSRDWIDRPALDVLKEIQRPAPLRPAILSPQALLDLWDEQSAIGRQRRELTDLVDQLDRSIGIKRGDLAETAKLLERSDAHIDRAQQQLDGFDSAWSRFRNRDTIDTLHNDIDRSNDWVNEYETRAGTLRAEIAQLGGDREHAIAQREALRPALVERSRGIQSVLSADAGRRATQVERDPPAHLRGLHLQNADAKLWRTTVGGIEQYRAAYGIDSGDPLGARRGYLDMTRADRYRQLEHSIDQLTPTRARDREMDMGIEM